MVTAVRTSQREYSRVIWLTAISEGERVTDWCSVFRDTLAVILSSASSPCQRQITDDTYVRVRGRSPSPPTDNEAAMDLREPSEHLTSTTTRTVAMRVPPTS